MLIAQLQSVQTPPSMDHLPIESEVGELAFINEEVEVPVPNKSRPVIWIWDNDSGQLVFWTRYVKSGCWRWRTCKQAGFPVVCWVIEEQTAF